ncbi:MAG: LysM peptidoglycan-binding domain-containing protein [Cytophagaceae bacterium]|nr:LysM peptidoglycan-binding domain-containing protein [Cytophagaceae bacterium]
MNRKAVISCIVMTVFILLSISQFSYAQKKKSKKNPLIKMKKDINVIRGDQYYDNYEFFAAGEEYKKTIDKDPENYYAAYKYAEACREYFDYVNAEKYYKKTIDKSLDLFPIARFWYGFMQLDNGNYEPAKKTFDTFVNEYKVTTLEAEEYKERARQGIKGCEFALAEMQKPKRDYNFTDLPEPINTEYSEYSPVIADNDSSIIVTSSRKESKGHAEFNMLGGAFSDMFRIEQGAGGWVMKDNADKFDVNNTTFNESAGSFTADNKKFYFTRCDEKIKVGAYEEFNCVIYVAKKSGEGSDASWGPAVRLNENVNMKGQWNSQPSVSPDGKILFFVSKRPGGLGMHDIWFSTCNGDDQWRAANNMGEGVNSIFIDMSPRYFAAENLLFFSSNGREGIGGLDIYMSSESTEFKETKNIGMPFNSHRDDFYFVLGAKRGYVASNRQGGKGNDDIYTFTIKSKETLLALIEKDSIIEDVKSISVEGSIVDEKTQKPVADLNVALTDENSVQLKTTTTDNEGKFKFDNLPAGKTYKVVLIEENAKLTQRIQYMIGDVEVKGSDKVASRRLFENVYFDFNKEELRPEAKKVLNELVTYSKKYPEVQIEMNANTDSIGTVDYNKKLSEQRGDAARQYLVGAGLKQSDMVVNSLGKGHPLAPNLNQIGRLLNRRVEFYVLGGPGYEAKTMTYVIEPRENIYDIAKRFQMSVQELKELNDLNADQLIPYTPLRVRRHIGDDDIIAQATMEQSFKQEKKGKKYYQEKIKKEQGLNASLASANQLIKLENDSIAKRNDVRKEVILHKKVDLSMLKEGEDYYITQPKNTLYTIAKLYGMKVEDIFAINSLKNDTIFVGQYIKVKTQTRPLEANEYFIQEGDTLEKLAMKFKISVETLRNWNHLDGYLLRKNMIVRVKS